jgi:hypothetical protein
MQLVEWACVSRKATNTTQYRHITLHNIDAYTDYQFYNKANKSVVCLSEHRCANDIR